MEEELLVPGGEWGEVGEELRVSPVPVLSRLTGEEIWLSRAPEELKGE